MQLSQHRTGVNTVDRVTHNFEELALHLVGPALTLQLVGDLKHLLYRPWDHSYSQIGLSLHENPTRYKK